MRVAMVVLLLVGAMGAAFAQDKFGETDNRYDVNRVDGALQVGIAADLVPLCTWRAGGWACATEHESRASQTMPQESAGREIARLENEIAALKRRLAEADEPLAVAPAPGKTVPLAPARRGVIARVSDGLAAAWRRVVDMIVGVFG